MSAGIDDKPGDDGPTRPTNLPHARQTLDGPGMGQANAAANERFKRNSEALQKLQTERREAREQPQVADKTKGPTHEAPAQQQDAAPAKGQERTLIFAADRGGSSRVADLNREQAPAAQAKGQERTLTFAADRGGSSRFDALKREQSAAPAKGQERTLTFAPDRGGKGPGKGHDGR